MLNEIKRTRMSTNGWSNVDYTNSAKEWAKHTQNSRVYLEDVAYLVEVAPRVPKTIDNLEHRCAGINLEAKHEEILRRRLEEGLVGSKRNVLFLGKNDCPCTVELVTKDTEVPESFYKDKKEMVFYSIPVIQSFSKISFTDEVAIARAEGEQKLADLKAKWEEDMKTIKPGSKKESSRVNKYNKDYMKLQEKIEVSIEKAKASLTKKIESKMAEGNVFKSTFIENQFKSQGQNDKIHECYYKSHFHHKDLVMKRGKIIVSKAWYDLWGSNI